MPRGTRTTWHPQRPPFFHWPKAHPASGAIPADSGCSDGEPRVRRAVIGNGLEEALLVGETIPAAICQPGQAARNRHPARCMGLRTGSLDGRGAWATRSGASGR